jgi:hypothetical protein
MSAFTFSFFRKKISVPVIFSMHLHFDEKALRTQFIAKIASLADLICCISKSVFEEMELYIPEAKNKLRLIYYGLAVPNLRPSPISFSDPVLAMIGRFVPQKGFDTAIRAFSLLKEKKSNAKLLIGGYGAEKASLEQLVKDLKLTDSVEFVGEVQREDVPSFINRSTILMVPSHFEPFGLVALEGMQMGRPMIVSHVGGLKELITDRKTGLFVPPQNPVALSHAIEYLLDRPEEAIQMGKEARKEAIEKFKLECNVDRHLGLYSEAMSLMFRAFVLFFFLHLHGAQIEIVYHIATLNNWKEIVQEQVAGLQNSGLSEACSHVTVTVAGPKIRAVRSLFEKVPFREKVELIHVGSLNVYEFPAIEKVKEIAHRFSDAKILYLHTKGVTHYRKQCEENVRLWRQYLEYFVVKRWKECLDALDSFDICSAEWNEQPELFFAGNFWWARADYLQTCRGTAKRYGRWDCEYFVGSGKMPRVKNFHSSGHFLYDFGYLPEYYQLEKKRIF